MSDTKRNIPEWMKLREESPWWNGRKLAKAKKGADGIVKSDYCGSANGDKLDTYDDIGKGKHSSKSKTATHQIRRNLNRIDDDTD